MPPRGTCTPRPLILLSRFAHKQKIRVPKYFSPLSSTTVGSTKGLERGLGGEVILFLVLLLAACSPRELPPQLAYTAGPPYTLDNRTLTTARYTVETPDGWRVIAGPAEDPYTFQFVAPDNDALIVLSDHEIENPPLPLNAEAAALETQSVEARGGDSPLYAVLVAPSDEIRAYRPLLDALIGSIR